VDEFQKPPSTGQQYRSRDYNTGITAFQTKSEIGLYLGMRTDWRLISIGAEMYPVEIVHN
jgi:hypothetical protein